MSTRLFLRQHPLQFWRLGLWLLCGRARLKARLAQHVALNVKTLTYNQPLVEFIQEARQRGYHIVLATAANQAVAQAVADYLGLFDAIIASDERVNRRAQAKAAALCQRFGDGQFIYVGNSHDDLKVWTHSARVVVVNARPRVVSAARRMSPTTVVVQGFREKDLAALREIL